MIHLFNKADSKLSTIMVAFDSGQRIEAQNNFSMGIAHMLEHCLFKGTSKRNSIQVSRDIGFLGAFSNAFTSHEMVAYFITVPYENTDQVCEILSDILLNSIIPEEEFLKEREVVKEEEIARLDDIDSFMWNSFSSEFFTNYLSTPVIGTQDTISSFTRDDVYSFYKNFCNRDKAVVSLSGNHTKRFAKKILQKHFGKPNDKEVANSKKDPSGYTSGVAEISKPGIEHTYVWIGYPGIPKGSSFESAARVLNTILGVGMDSRLFSEVRERNGLAYGISSSHSQWNSASLFLIESATREENLDNMLGLVSKEINRVSSDLVSEEELQRAKNKIKAGCYGLLESSYGLSIHAIKERLFGTPTIDELISGVDAVSVDDILEVANIIFDAEKEYRIVCRGE